MTPKLTEVKCPQCGQWAEVFVKMNGRPGQTGTLATQEVCPCGYIFQEGSFVTDYEQ